jgi:hypothetical protein
MCDRATEVRQAVRDEVPGAIHKKVTIPRLRCDNSAIREVYRHLRLQVAGSLLVPVLTKKTALVINPAGNCNSAAPDWRTERPSMWCLRTGQVTGS